MSRLAPHLPLQRISTAEDIAAMICAALEQEAMTGQIITVDSGQTLEVYAQETAITCDTVQLNGHNGEKIRRGA